MIEENMEDKIRFGLVGYGKVAALHAQALATTPHASLVAVSGHRQERRDAFAATWKIASRPTIADMVAKDGVQAVIVTTPHPQHFQDGMEALAAGCHVLIEKPLTLSTKDAENLIQKANAQQRLLSVISQRRWYPACQRIRNAIDQGLLGETCAWPAHHTWLARRRVLPFRSMARILGTRRWRRNCESGPSSV